jgi:hypothetical protein
MGMRLYASAKMRGIPEYNFPLFDKYTAALRAAGHDVINPADIDRAKAKARGCTIDDLRIWELLPDDVAAIMDPATDGIVLLPTWEDSSGVVAEAAAANACSPKKPFFLADELLAGVVRPFHIAVRAVVEAAAPYSATMTAASEERVTDPATGATKGVKMAQFALLPWDVLWKVAEHFTRGTQVGYPPRNWEKGAPWSRLYDALVRHLALWWMGEDWDPKEGQGVKAHHLDAVIFWALALRRYALVGVGTDDRPRPPSPPSMPAQKGA